MTTWPSMAGVMITVYGAPGTSPRPPALRRARGVWGVSKRVRLPLVPGGSGEARLAAGELVRPHRHLLAVEPLEHHHLVRDLEAVGVHLVVAEERPRFQLEQLLAHLVRVQAAGAAHAFRIEDAARVAGGRVVDRLVPELLLISGDKFLLARIGQARFPLGRAVHEFGVLLEEIVELREIPAHRDAVHP